MIRERGEDRYSFSRRGFLTSGAAAATALAGCTDSNTQNQNTGTDPEEPATNTTDENDSSGEENGYDREEIVRSIPFDGLGAYTDAVLESDGTRFSRGISEMLEGNLGPRAQAEEIAEIATTDKAYGVMQQLYKQLDEENPENTVVANTNYAFTGRSGPVLEIYPVQNRELKKPVIKKDGNIHKPGQKIQDSGDDVLKRLRDDGWAAMMPQNYDAMTDRIEYGREDGGTDEEVRAFREAALEDWSWALFGIEKDDTLIPWNTESSNIVFDGMYHEGNIDAVIQLNNQYRESEHFQTDTTTAAKYTGNEWNFTQLPERELGNPLPGN